jgi:hypothetical protein
MNAQDQIIASKAEALITLQTLNGNESPMTNNRWENRTVISNIRDCFIEILHHDADPSTWIVRRWKKILWFKKRISSDWFINRHQAFAYAHEMKGTYNRLHGIYAVKEKQFNAL